MKDSIQIQGSATDVFGKIVSWEWKFGSNDWISASGGDTTIIAPSVAQLYACSLRVTDDDNFKGSVGGTVFILEKNKQMIKIFAKGKPFKMGSLSGQDNEKPVHTINFTYDFWMDTTEVTQKDYSDLMIEMYPGYSDPPWTAGKGDNYPAYSVNWYDAVLYCNARSKNNNADTIYTYTKIRGIPGNNCELEGLQIDLNKNGYRLPTEAEWEYTCRSLTTTDYYWGDKKMDDYAWFAEMLRHEVAKKLPNSFRLYDMSGNVLEWCNDWYDTNYYSKSPNTDPLGPISGSERLIRGGGGHIPEIKYYRSAHRLGYKPNSNSSHVGFRVVYPIPSTIH